MKKLALLILLLTFAVLVAGCTVPETPQEAELPEVSDPLPLTDEQITEGEEVIEEPVIEPVYTEPTLVDATRLTSGKRPNVVVYEDTAYLVYERYKDASTQWDVYLHTGKPGAWDDATVITAGTLNDIYPVAVWYKDLLYVFYTRRSSDTTPVVALQLTTWNKSAWSTPEPIFGIDSGRFSRGTVALHDYDLYYFFQDGLETDQSAIGSRIRNINDLWHYGIMTTPVNGDERDPVVTAHGDELHMLYRVVRSSTEEDALRHRIFLDGKWKTFTKLEEFGLPQKIPGGLASFNGKIYATWHADDELYLAAYADGAWSETTRLTDNTVREENPELFVYGDALYVAYTEYTNAGAPFVYVAEVEGL